METRNCYCGTEKAFLHCCKPYIKGIEKAPTAEALMRSRYSAYCIEAADYIVATTHSTTRKFHKKEDILAWSKSNQWLRLEVLQTTEQVVEFKAYFLDNKLKANVHHEKSTFIAENGSWFYVDGLFYWLLFSIVSSLLFFFTLLLYHSLFYKGLRYCSCIKKVPCIFF